MTSSNFDISSNLEKARRDLIDQGLRNPLINYRVLRAKGLEIVDERTSEVYQMLVVRGRQMDFLSDPTKDQEDIAAELVERRIPSHWFNPLYPFLVIFLIRYEIKEKDDLGLGQPEEAQFGDDPTRHTDQHLQTPYSTKELQKRLLETSDTARVYIEEQGVNLLYLALGELVWYEDKNSQQGRRAPLILVPVELSRKSVDARFTVKYTEGGIGGNVSLREKLQSDFRIQVPAPLDDNTDEAEFDINDYFDKVAEVISNQAQWRLVRDSIQVGFFSFGKFMMYHDLDEAVWPERRKPSDHPILSKLLGEGFEQTLRTTIEEITRDEIDRYLAVDNNFHIMDADSSQAQAIMAVKNGKSLAIQGPPGTGKSQTIANIMAEMVGSGQTVLFVAEKMAALEVVKRRLDHVGLGDLCLELHSHKANKRTVLAELDRTFRLGAPENKDIDLFDLEPSRSVLNAYSEAVNDPIGNTGIDPYHAYGESLRLVDKMQDIAVPTWSDHSVLGWSQQVYRQKLELVEDLQRRFQHDDLPKNNIFYGADISAIIPSTRDSIKRQANDTLASYSRLIDQARALAELLEILPPKNLTEYPRLVQIGLAIANLPNELPTGKLLREWSQISFKLSEVIDAGITFSAINKAYADKVHNTVWSYDLVSIEEAIRNNSGVLARFFSPKLHRAKKQLSEFLVSPIQDSADQLQVLQDLIKAQRCKLIIDEYDEMGRTSFEVLWLGHHSDWSSLKEITQSLRQITAAIKEGYLPVTALDTILPSQAARIRQAVNDVSSIHEEFQRYLNSLFKLIEYNHEAQREISLLSTSELLARLQSWQSYPEQITQIAAFNSAREKFNRENLDEFYKVVSNWENAAHHTVNLFKRNWFDQLITQAIRERPALRDFDGLNHQARLSKFREMDRLLLDRNKHVIASKHSENLSKTSPTTGQVRILREEFAKKRRHKPIRKLIAETYSAVQTIKPIFMMSPMSVASYLEPGTIEFDVVIFDEASQIRPADAFGSILRAKQTIVVGDNRQMPPTSFFDSIGETDEDDETSVSDFDSILDLFTSKGIKDQMLRWHYRSRHESLIAVSNYEFYENKLLIAPSPQPRDPELGLVLNYLPDTVYEPGTRRYNRMEAHAVAEAVIKHARQAPGLTLGVAAFSQSQMQAIRDELEVLRRNNLDCESFFNLHPEEPFFVKNLENVQGDERDVIFISIGYGKTSDGTISMNFGPLNRDGGERRLNVLISRARLRCEVFTNLSSDDIDLDRTRSRGVSALKSFLKYARTGELGFDTTSGRGPGSPFEEAVAEKLIQRGYRIHYQVGTAGFFIDLAVVDPDNPGKYLVGIECDGAAYHRSASARDRDRLRQAILESKGWTIYRIWSTDWFNNPDKELVRAVEAIEEIRRSVPYRASANQRLEAKIVEIERVERPVNFTDEEIGNGIDYSIAPYKMYKGERKRNWASIDEVPLYEIKSQIADILDVESPLHIEELERRVVHILGFSRTTQKAKTTIQDGLRSLASSVTVVDDFVMSKKGKDVVVRDRSRLPNESRKVEYIHPREIEMLAQQICQVSVGIRREELIREICRLFGFNRVSQQMQDRVGEAVNRLIDSGKLVERTGGIWIAD